jgi:hypothetical protein
MTPLKDFFLTPLKNEFRYDMNVLLFSDTLI